MRSIFWKFGLAGVGFFALAGGSGMAQTSTTAGMSGGISGVIANAQGQPIGNVRVTASRIPDVSHGDFSGFANLSMLTPAPGAFSFGNLTACRYRICARALSGKWLDTCEWPPAGGPLVVSVTGGQTAAAGTISLASGVTLRVRVSDPQGLVAQAIQQGPLKTMHIFVQKQGGLPLPEECFLTQVTGTDCTWIVSVASPLIVIPKSASLVFKDNGGLFTWTGGPTQVSVSAAADAAGTPQIMLVITGVN